MTEVSPFYRLSKHFLLADFLGNHSVYSRGFKNVLEGDASEVEFKLDNAIALCNEILEPAIDRFGPLSISYGYISPEVSRAIITYQDPNKPSHHRWDLGAAADVCVHRWVQGLYDWPDYDPNQGTGTSPVWLGHMLDQHGLPYSRLITYSESPFLCLACSAAEVRARQPRKAFYENRYHGHPRAKPEYLTYASDATRQRAFRMLSEQGLEAPWQGTGHPTYHGGGRKQYQHERISKYTMLSDWLFDLQSIANGFKNIPALTNEAVLDALGAAGLVYDMMVDQTHFERFTIAAGYVSHMSPAFSPENDWRTGSIAFRLIPPEGGDVYRMAEVADGMGLRHEQDTDEGGGLWIAGEVGAIYEQAA